MTKEELEKEADDNAEKHAFRVPYDGSNKFYDDVDFKASKEGYLAGAEPRKKQITDLEDKLANADYQLEGRDNEIKELEAQIEKMKCCGNCMWSDCDGKFVNPPCKYCDFNNNKWELRR